MDNLERINDIFDKTDKILNLWTTMDVEYNDNPQVSHILYYLSLTAGYLKGKEEAEVFKSKWESMKEKIELGSDEDDWLNQSHMIISHLEQALREEDVHNPKKTLQSEMNPGIEPFYENQFSKLYEAAKIERDNFQKKQDDIVKGMQQHHAEVFASQESWEAAVRRGDPMAWVD
jgi:hypothetical protein